MLRTWLGFSRWRETPETLETPETPETPETLSVDIRIAFFQHFKELGGKVKDGVQRGQDQ